MERSPEEQQRYDNQQTKWSFHILKDKRVARWIIYACGVDALAAAQLQLFFKFVDQHPENKSQDRLAGQDIPIALQRFRDNEDFSYEFITGNGTCAEAILLFYRVKSIRTAFVQPGLPESSTDSDQSTRVQSARRQLQDDATVRGFNGLSDALQALVADVHWTRVPGDATLRSHIGLQQRPSNDDSEESSIHPAPNSEHSHGEEGSNKKRRTQP